MKIAFVSFFLLFVLFWGFMAKSAPLNEYVDFYLGSDAQIRRMKFNTDHGEKMLPKHSPQGNLYAGVNLNEWLAFEAGYESTMARKKTSYFVSGQAINGVILPDVIPHVSLESKSRIKGFHFDFMGFHKLGKHSPWKIFLGLGICELKGNVIRSTIDLGGRGQGKIASFCKRYTALRVSSGAQYDFDNGFGVRGTASFVKTGRMSIKIDDGVHRLVLPVFKPKDSFVLGLGALYKF